MPALFYSASSDVLSGNLTAADVFDHDRGSAREDTVRPQSVHLRFDAGTHPPEERIRAWRQALGFSHDTVVRPEDVDAFEARFDGYHLGALLLADIRAGRHTSVRTRADIARHAFDYVAVDVLLEGAFSGRFGARRAEAGPGDCLFVDLCDTMELDVTAHRCLTLAVPRALFAARVGPADRIGGRVLPSHTPEARLLGGELRNLLEVAPDLTEALADAAGSACLDLVAACLAPRRAPGRLKSFPVRAPAPTLARLERFVARNLARSDLGPALLCRQFGLSRTALYELAQPAGGVAALVRRLRAAEAHRLLTSPTTRDLTTDEVSRRSGFGDVRALRRALNGAYRASPRALRLRGARAPADQPVDVRTSAWIDAV